MKTNKKILSRNIVWLSGLMTGLSSSVIAADQLSLSAGAGLELHDNAAHLESDEKSDLNRFINADIGYQKTDGNVRADIGYRAERSDFLRDYDEDNTAVNGHGMLKWLIAPRLLDASLSHQISETQSNRRELDVASNRERRSITTAAINGYLHLSAVDSIILTPRFSDIGFEDSTDSDSQRSSMTVAWQHELSQVSSLSLNANYDHVTFDESINDYDSPSVMLLFKAALSRLSYQIGLGATRFERDEGEDFNGSTAQLAIDYVSPEGTQWGGSYLHQLTDSSVGLSTFDFSLNNSSSTDFNSGDSNFEEFDVIKIDRVEAYWKQRLNASNQINADIGYRKEDYKETPQDQDVGYVQLGYLYTINSLWSAGLDARYERTKFVDEPTQKYDTTRVRLNATYRVSRPLEIRFSIGQDKRDADESSDSYTDNVALIGMNYRFF